MVWAGVVLAAIGFYFLCITESFSVNFGDMLIFLCAGCALAGTEDKTIEEELPENSTKLYYMNEERTKVISQSFSLKNSTVEAQIAEFLTALEEILWTDAEKELITDKNPIYEFKWEDTGLLTLRFSADYSASPNISDVLRRTEPGFSSQLLVPDMQGHLSVVRSALSSACE